MSDRGPLRLAFDGTPLLHRRTGIGNVAAELLDRFAVDPALEVVTYAATWRGRGELGGLTPPGVRVATRPLPARPARAMWKRTSLPPIQWWTGPVDAVYSANFVVPPARGAARVVTVNDLTPLRFPEMCTPDTLEYPRLLRRAIRDGAWVHTLSEFVADEVRTEFDVDDTKVVPVHLGAMPIGPGDAAAGRALAGGTYVLSLGTVEPRKAYPLLVEAFDQLAPDHDDLRLVIAGPDGWGVEHLDRSIRRATHRDRVVRLGWVTDQQRADLLHGASVFAYPSVYEGFGLPPLEAMGAGVPVVATRAGAIPEIVGDAAELVDVGDADGLARAIGRVLSDAERRRDLRAAGHRNLHRFSWDRTAASLAEVFLQAAGRGGQGS
jgi:glycosyltransferase involved in cell wall biosynthesis